MFSVGRKKGKLALAAAPVLAHPVGLEAIGNGEISSAATERDQAAIVFKIAVQMVRADAELLAMIKIFDSIKTMDCMHNGSVCRAISAEPRTEHGVILPLMRVCFDLGAAASHLTANELEVASSRVRTQLSGLSLAPHVGYCYR